MAGGGNPDGDWRRARKHSTKIDPVRNRFQQDRDRLLYSAGFRRLAGITQIAAASEVTLLHNRLTHSLKVAQVGRRLTQRLIRDYRDRATALGIDPDVVEAAGLAHDIGHPPFGHAVEGVLNNKLSRARAGGFEGNAQTFRYLTKTALRRAEEQGPGSGALDLTRASLNAVIKYPWCEHDSRTSPPIWVDRHQCPPSKWNAYEIDRGIFSWVRDGLDPGYRSPEAAIMDWADDVSYAVHDFEDYVRARLIPAHSIRRDLPAFTDYAWSILVRRHSGAGLDRTEFDEAINRIADFTVDDPYGGSRSDEAILNEWVSARITECLEGDAVELTDSQDSPVKVDAKRQYVVEVLKLFPVYYVIDSPPFAAAQEGQRRVVAGLFDSLMRMVEKRRTSVPRTLHEIVVSVENEPSVSAERMHNREFVAARSVVDYICTLTEAQAFELYERFRGSSPSMFHGPWL